METFLISKEFECDYCKAVFVSVKISFGKNLYSGTKCGGFQFLLILHLWGISFHAVVVFGLGKNHLLFKSSLGKCGPALLKDVQFDPCTSN